MVNSGRCNVTAFVVIGVALLISSAADGSLDKGHRHGLHFHRSTHRHSRPKVIKPKVFQPKAFHPKVFKPKAIQSEDQPKVFRPKAIQPKVFQPKAIQSGVIQPMAIQSGNQAKVFNVMNFGAKADGKTNNFEQFVAAWKAACFCGAPAKLVFPPGTYLTGPVYFHGPCLNPILVEIRGTIKASTDDSDFANGEWIVFEQIDGLILTGGGTLDGQGASSWKYNDCAKKPGDCTLPAKSLIFHRVSNSAVYGINSINPKAFHVFVTFCSNLALHDLKISAPEDSPNTDGIHVSGSSFINITNSRIGTGDDCISIGQGSTNIAISNIICGPGHGISVGSLGKRDDEKDVSGVVVKNCTLSHTSNGLRIKTWPDSPPIQASGIIFQDIIMDTVRNPIIIDQNYGSSKKVPSRVKLSNIHYKNIRGTSNSSVAVSLSCSSLVRCKGVEFVDIDLVYNGARTGKGVPKPLSSSCLNADVTSAGKQNPPACA